MTYDVTFAGNIDGWHAELEVTVNGELGVAWDEGDSGSRSLIYFEEQSLLMLIDCSCYQQASDEAAIWHNMSPDHRSLFVPVLACGEVDDGTETRGWVIKPFYSDFETVDLGPDECFDPIDETVEELHDQLGVVARKYGLGSDWCVRQWKRLSSGVPIIHDYGCSTAFGGSWRSTADPVYLPPYWQKIRIAA